MIQNKCNLKVIGLTGGIASGKSTVSKMILEKGYPVIDADKIAREVVQVGKSAYKKIVDIFGTGILNDDLTINRQKLGDIVFKDEQKRRLLNNAVHPEVVKEIKEKIEKYSKYNNVIFLDIPLLIEEYHKLTGWGLKIHEIWLVYVPKEIQIERLMKRDNLDIEDALGRIKAQMPLEEKKKYADVIIDNSNNIEDLKGRLYKLLDAF